jgi:hypothetical protein
MRSLANSFKLFTTENAETTKMIRKLNRITKKVHRDSDGWLQDGAFD